MFEGIASPAQSMLWLAIIEAVGFTAFTALAILPLVRALREQIETADRRHHEQMEILIRLLARDAKGDRAAPVETKKEAKRKEAVEEAGQDANGK